MTKPNTTRFAGFSMIETLVAILVLGIGLLGMLGVSFNSLKLSSTSSYRSIAAQQAYAMAEAVRANPPTIATSTTETVFASPPSASVNANCLRSTGCNRTDYVGTQFKMWQDQLASLLPNGLGNVCRDDSPENPTTTATGVSDWKCSGSGQYVVKICWNESRISASSPTTSAGGFLCTWTNI